MIKLFKTITLLVPFLILSSLFSQNCDSIMKNTPTLGVSGRLTFGGFDETGKVTVNIDSKGTIYTKRDKSGLNFWTFANAQISNKPLWTYFSLGFGYQFQFKNRDGFNSNLELGMGMGFQSIPHFYFDTTSSRIIAESPMRGMGYVNGQFPIKWNGVNHALIFSNSVDMSFGRGPIESSGTVPAIFTYRYRSFVVLQLTNSRDDINLFAGFHAEKTLAIGPTFRIHFCKNQLQISGVFGYNQQLNNFSGGGGLDYKF